MTTTVQARYEVGYNNAGECIEFFPSQRQAFDKAYELDSFLEDHAAEVVYIFDRMAHVGKPQLWFVEDGNIYTKEARNA